MPFTSDQIIDRMNLKKQMSNWRIVAVVSILIIVALIVGSKNFKNVGIKGNSQYIARLKLEGIIVNDLARTEHIKGFAKDRAIKGIILHINSPGGTVVGGENLHTTILELTKTVPVAIVMDDVAASAGYMVATAGDYIVAHQGTITGSIGVIAQSFEVVELADKLGIKFNTFKSSPLKGGPLPTERMTPAMQDAMNNTIEELYNMFVSLVAKRRNIPIETLLPIADGRVYTGQQAFDLKLIDAVGNENTALEWLKANKKLAPDIKIIDLDIDPAQDDFNKFFGVLNNLSTTLKMLFNSNLSYFS